MLAIYSLAFLLTWICAHVRAAYVYKDWLYYEKDQPPYRRIDGRVTGTPADCCSQCGARGLDAEQPNIPVAAGYDGGPHPNLAYGTHGKTVLSDEELTSAILCVSGYAGSTTCECRLDVGIYVNANYACENNANEWWRYEGITVLTGGPYEKLIVDSVWLKLMCPWTLQYIMLWISLFKTTDPNPCDIKNYDDRKIEFVETRWDMSQYNYYFYPNETMTVPSGWSFVTEAEPDNIVFMTFMEVGTMAHIVRGSSE